MPIVVVLVTVLVTYASTRFRTTAEPALVVLAALAIDAVLARVSTTRARLPADPSARAGASS
jgi:hypothetical protein